MTNDNLQEALKWLNMSQDEFARMYNGIKNVALHGETDYYRWMKGLAKQKNVNYDAFLQFMRIYEKEQIKFADRIKHYHKTSFDKFKSIIEKGALLSRVELKMLGVDTSAFGWSASQNVQFTRNYFDDNGNMVESGLSNHGVGNISKGIIFVMGPELIKVENYDCFGKYPTVSNANIRGNCMAILADDEAVLLEAAQLLKDYNMEEIPVILRANWDVNMLPMQSDGDADKIKRLV